jgi:hypothetical protein
LLQDYLPLFVAINKHTNQFFYFSRLYFMFLSLPSSSGSTEYSEHYRYKSKHNFGILEPACAPFARDF